MKKVLASTVFFFLLSGFAMAQSEKSQSQERTSKGDDFFKGYEFKEQKANKKSNIKLKKRKAGRSNITAYYDRKIEEYKDRMEANAERYKEMSKEMEKPQYSDPTYFGHKKPPKKRPVGKKKFCKICGIVH